MADKSHKVFSSAAAAAAAAAVPTNLHSMASLLKPQKPSDPLPPDFEPGPLDVCSGRGKRNWNHSGNVAFRHRIQSQVEDYINAPTKNQKTAIVCTIVDEMRQQGCRFLQQNKQNRWYDIGDAKARDKVGHGLRDQVTAINRGQASIPPPPPAQKQPMVFTTSLSDSEGEENIRRRSGSADMITRFTRRPSWIAEENSSASAQMDGIPVAEFEQQRRSSSSVGWSMLLQDDGIMLQELMDLDISHNSIDNLVDGSSNNPEYEQYNSNVAYPSQQQQQPQQPQTQQQHYQPQQQQPQQYPPTQQQQLPQQLQQQQPQQYLQQQPQQQQKQQYSQQYPEQQQQQQQHQQQYQQQYQQQQEKEHYQQERVATGGSSMELEEEDDDIFDYTQQRLPSRRARAVTDSTSLLKDSLKSWDPRSSLGTSVGSAHMADMITSSSSGASSGMRGSHRASASSRGVLPRGSSSTAGTTLRRATNKFRMSDLSMASELFDGTVEWSNSDDGEDLGGI